MAGKKIGPIRESVISIVPIVLVLFFALIYLCPLAEAEDCMATVSPDLSTAHVPAVEFNGHIYSGDLNRVPSNDGNMWFEATGIQAADGVQCGNPGLYLPTAGAFVLLCSIDRLGSRRVLGSAEI